MFFFQVFLSPKKIKMDKKNRSPNFDIPFMWNSPGNLPETQRENAR